jgi:acetyl-CoA acetyltransferase
VLTSAARARDLAKPPVYLLGTGEATNHRNISQLPDLTTTEASRSAERAMRMAGIDTAHVYDAFTISLLILLEDLGFCAKGEGGPYIADGNTGPGGTLALNTNGGAHATAILGSSG